MIILNVPTVNDDNKDFDRLFSLWDQVNDDSLDVAFNFSHCHFLRQNAVAFIGGLARLIESRGGRVEFRWDTLQQKIFTNLAQNGFLCAFGNSSGPWCGNSIPFREDLFQDKNAVVDYLKTQWLGREWMSISDRLRDNIVGNVWEIYTNAFEHGSSAIGVFSCGQHYPWLHELKLTVVDFGEGIPATVRWHFRNSPSAQNLSDADCLRWAFRNGTTTKPDGIGRGVGLDLLRDFIQLNNGKLEIFSHNGYTLIDGSSDIVNNRASFFQGTLANITLKCDESFYHFSDEPIQGPYF
ncbi:MAG: ATP-binding protein [Candidatus Electrothrix aestuarii]|uniref:ATP-binding protein n=1 Tax=Candidatus Electrothrix aestuarii TaxID=3062594 RepID=A0AAU8LXC1_9BACT|nr:ATP-binding protein [Candidatus Electrothrix aestuarii]